MHYAVANWKMQLGVGEATAAARTLAASLAGTDARVVVCPTHAELSAVGQALKGSGVLLGSQDVAADEKGAYTGEVSAAELAELRCEYCIVGHSERRAAFGETDTMVRAKLTRLFAHGITPILCVGETREEHLRGITAEVLRFQLGEGLLGVTAPAGATLLVAYEPRWAIGTGLAASPEDASAAAAVIREALVSSPFAHVGSAVLYGGSVDVSNVASFVAAPGIDGVLVGSASLDPAAFIRVVHLL
jgi:triosephosphate isomerase